MGVGSFVSSARAGRFAKPSVGGTRKCDFVSCSFAMGMVSPMTPLLTAVVGRWLIESGKRER